MKSHRDQTEIFTLVVGVLAILALGNAFAWVINQQTILLSPQATVFPIASEVMAGSETPKILTALPTANVTPISGETPDISATQTQEVIATLVADKQIMAATLANQLPIATPEPGPTGIVDDNYVKFSGSKLGLDTQNGWSGIENGNLVGVWAGSLIGDSQQGALYLILTLPYRFYKEQFLTADKHGALHIVAEQNNRLVLISTDGTTYYFDVPARRFVSSLDDIVPTATPLPTYTPYAPPTPAPMPTGYPNPLP